MTDSSYREEPSYYLNLKCDRCGAEVIACGDCGETHCSECIQTFDLEEVAELDPCDETQEAPP